MRSKLARHFLEPVVIACGGCHELRSVRTSPRCSSGNANTDAFRKGMYSDYFTVTNKSLFLGRALATAEGKQLEMSYEGPERTNDDERTKGRIETYGGHVVLGC